MSNTNSRHNESIQLSDNARKKIIKKRSLTFDDLPDIPPKRKKCNDVNNISLIDNRAARLESENRNLNSPDVAIFHDEKPCESRSSCNSAKSKRLISKENKSVQRKGTQKSVKKAKVRCCVYYICSVFS